jgi:hypothetical protein
MNPFASEFFGQSILRRIGIRTVEHTSIYSEKEASELPGDFVVKFAKEGLPFNLKWRPGEVPAGDCLASRIVPHAASLSYVARHILKTREGSDLSDKFYLGFQTGLTSVQVEAIRRAMDFDKAPYLTIAAVRLFFNWRFAGKWRWNFRVSRQLWLRWGCAVFCCDRKIQWKS